jgi:DNA-binding NtrC family response regulator
MPPLRERGDDIELLADHFLAVLNERNDAEKAFDDEARQAMRQHPWPGNVRELKNTIHRAFIMADDVITPASLPARVGGSAAGGRRVLEFPVGTSISDVERQLIGATLEEYGGNKKKTADVLGVSLKTLYNRLNAYKNGEDTPEDDEDD